MYSIDEFFRRLMNFTEIKEDIINGDQKHKVFEAIGAYMDIIKENIEKEELFAVESKNMSFLCVHSLNLLIQILDPLL